MNFRRCILVFGLAASVAMIAPAPASASVFGDAWRGVKKTTKKVGRAAGGAAKDVGRATGKAAKATGRAVGGAGKAIGKGTVGAGKFVINTGLKGADAGGNVARKGIQGVQGVVSGGSSKRNLAVQGGATAMGGMVPHLGVAASRPVTNKVFYNSKGSNRRLLPARIK